MTELIPRALARKNEVALAIAALFVSYELGKKLAESGGSLVFLAVMIVLIVGLIAFSIGTEFVIGALLVTAPIGLEQITQGQRTLVPVAGGWAVSSLRLALLLGAAFGLFALRGLTRRLTVPEQLYIGLVLWLTMMLSISPSVFEGVRFTAKVGALIAAWLAFGWTIDRYGAERVWRLFWYSGVVALGIDLVMVAAGVGFNHSVLDPPRFAGIAGAPASGAIAIALLGLVALYRWFIFRDRAGLVVYVLAWIPIFVSLTRIAIIAFLLGSAFLAILLGHRTEAIVVLVAIISIASVSSSLRERMAWGKTGRSWSSIFHAYQQGRTGNLNFEGRLILWRPLWDEWKKSPIAGNGTGAAAVTITKTSNDAVEQAHSDYLALLVNGGVIALGLWLLALGGLMVKFARARGPGSIAAAGIFMYLIVAITDNSIEMYGNVGLLLAALIALSFNALAGSEDQQA